MTPGHSAQHPLLPVCQGTARLEHVQKHACTQAHAWSREVRGKEERDVNNSKKFEGYKKLNKKIIIKINLKLQMS